MIKSKFKKKCPNCKRLDKVIIKCPLCFKYTCNECSIDLLCIDCFIEAKKATEIRIYFKDKYKNPMVMA